MIPTKVEKRLPAAAPLYKASRIRRGFWAPKLYPTIGINPCEIPITGMKANICIRRTIPITAMGIWLKPPRIRLAMIMARLPET